MSQSIPEKPILVERYKTYEDVETRLNALALDPLNRYDLKFFTHAMDKYAHYYTVILCWTPETPTT